MKKIMFLYHVEEREYQIIEMIKSQLFSYSEKLDIRVGEFYHSIKDTIDFKPDVIVSIPPRDCYSSNYLTVLKLLTKAVVISMTTEGHHTFEDKIVQDVIGFNSYSPKLVDYYIMWGAKTSNILGRKLFETGKVTNRKRIKTTGYAFYDLERTRKLFTDYPAYPEIVNWAKQYSRIHLVITGFSPADWSVQDYFYLGFFGEQKSVSKLTEEQIQEALKVKERYTLFRDKYINDIISVAEQMPDTGFFVKLHPVEISSKIRYYEKLSGYKNIYVVSTALPVGMLLSIADTMIHYNSTCNMEAYIYSVPTILRFLAQDSNLENILKESAYSYEINDREGFVNCLQNKCEFRRLPMTEKKLFDLFNWKMNKKYKPVEKIASYIFNAKKSQHLSCFDKEVIKAVESKEGEVIEEWLLYRFFEGKISRKMLYDLTALMKLQFIKIIGKLEGFVHV